MASVFYNNYFEELGKGNIDYTSDTFRIMLVTSAYTPNVDTHAYRSDVTGEASGSGYSAGGVVVTGVTLTQDNTNDRAVVDHNNVTFTNVTLANVVGHILYKDTGVSATSPLICFIDYNEGTLQVQANDFNVTAPVAGVHTIG